MEGGVCSGAQLIGAPWRGVLVMMNITGVLLWLHVIHADMLGFTCLVMWQHLVQQLSKASAGGAGVCWTNKQTIFNVRVQDLKSKRLIRRQYGHQGWGATMAIVCSVLW
jgi:hypothetical protein